MLHLVCATILKMISLSNQKLLISGDHGNFYAAGMGCYEARLNIEGTEAVAVRITI